MVLLKTVLTEGQLALLVIKQLITSPLFNAPDVKVALLGPILMLFLRH